MPTLPNNNDKKRWGRRVGSTLVWFVALQVAFYVSLFKGVDPSWFQYNAGFLTIGLGFLVGGLTITDAVLKK